MWASKRCLPVPGTGGDRHVKFVLLSRAHTVTTKYYCFSGGADTVSLKAVQDTLFIALIREPSLSLVAVAYHMSWASLMTCCEIRQAARAICALSKLYGRSRTQVREWIMVNFSGTARADRYYESDSLYSLLPELTPLMLPRTPSHSSLSLRFNVHWTRVSSYHPPRVPHTTLPPGMCIQSGRPDVFDVLQRVIDGVRTVYSTGWSDDSLGELPKGIVVGSCGPTALMDDAAQAVGRVSWMDWKGVGGVESVEECVKFFFDSLFLFCSRDRTGLSGGKNSSLISTFIFLCRCWTTSILMGSMLRMSEGA